MLPGPKSLTSTIWLYWVLSGGWFGFPGSGVRRQQKYSLAPWLGTFLISSSRYFSFLIFYFLFVAFEFALNFCFLVLKMLRLCIQANGLLYMITYTEIYGKVMPSSLCLYVKITDNNDVEVNYDNVLQVIISYQTPSVIRCI